MLNFIKNIFLSIQTYSTKPNYCNIISKNKPLDSLVLTLIFKKKSKIKLTHKKINNEKHWDPGNYRIL